MNRGAAGLCALVFFSGCAHGVGVATLREPRLQGALELDVGRGRLIVSAGTFTVAEAREREPWACAEVLRHVPDARPQFADAWVAFKLCPIEGHADRWLLSPDEKSAAGRMATSPQVAMGSIEFSAGAANGSIWFGRYPGEAMQVALPPGPVGEELGRAPQLLIAVAAVTMRWPPAGLSVTLR